MKEKSEKPKVAFECVSVALVIQHAKHMCCVVLSNVACLVLPYFSTLFHKQHDFHKNVIEHKMCFGFLYNFCLNISHSKKNSVRYYHECSNVFMYSTHYSRHILMKLEFS